MNGAEKTKKELESVGPFTASDHKGHLTVMATASFPPFKKKIIYLLEIERDSTYTLAGGGRSRLLAEQGGSPGMEFKPRVLGS